MDVETSPVTGLSMRQLALPLASTAAPAVAAAPTVPPAAVWATLPPVARLRLERAVRRVLAEVARDADRG